MRELGYAAVDAVVEHLGALRSGPTFTPPPPDLAKRVAEPPPEEGGSATRLARSGGGGVNVGPERRAPRCSTTASTAAYPSSRICSGVRSSPLSATRRESR